MTPEQVKQLTAISINLIAIARNKPQVWIDAFREYNADESNEKKLSIHCFPCYEKVLRYHVGKVKK